MNRYKIYVDILEYKNKYIVVKADDINLAKEKTNRVLFEMHGELPIINSVVLARRKR